MALISLQKAHFDYGREHILNDVDLALHPGVKCALVGPNGAGKTTLLAALAGELQLQNGTRQVMGSARIRLLRQTSSLTAEGDEGAPLLETVGAAAFAREREVEAELAQIAHRLEGAGDDLEALIQRQGQLQVEYERLDGYSARARLETALRGVGLPPESWDRPVGRLSGGERRRAALATVLLSNADLLLLDEPTNHLDLESCEWLEQFLLQCPAAAVIVSHDRQFLDQVATRTLHLDRGRLVSYSGNYSFFDKQSALRYEQELAAWQRQQTRFRQTEEYIRRNIEGQKTKQAQARRKQMDKEEKLDRPSAEPGLLHFDLQPARSSGGTVLETENLGLGWGDRTLIAGLDLHISRGDRVGIIGPNGCGKSTLLKALAGSVIPRSGRVVVGHNVDLGFYDQELTTVSDHNTVLNEMAAVDPRATVGELRSFLGAFGFGEDLYDRQVGRLSGGERGRLALMRLIKEGHNTLLLDEPTNHLDIRSRESLETSLADYTGTLLVVSHDRRFLDKLVQRLIIFPGSDAPERSQVTVFDGNYAEWTWHRDRRRQDAAAESPAVSPVRNSTQPQPQKDRPATAAAAAGKTPLSKNEQTRRRKLIAEAEETILALETEKEDTLGEMGRPDLDNDRRLELGRRCAEIDTELDAQMTAWEQWSLEIEEGI